MPIIDKKIYTKEIIKDIGILLLSIVTGIIIILTLPNITKIIVFFVDHSYVFFILLASIYFLSVKLDTEIINMEEFIIRRKKKFIFGVVSTVIIGFLIFPPVAMLLSLKPYLKWSFLPIIFMCIRYIFHEDK